MTTFHPSRRPAPRRRGSVLIFALAILAVMALLGAAYVTRANLDRVAATASVQRSSLERQPDKVIERLQSLLAADLFGNKIVTDATPSTVPAAGVETTGGGASGAVNIRPRMFEDGETWDYPSVDDVDSQDGANARYTFLRSESGDPDRPPLDSAKLRFVPAVERFQTARPDDAWLAATEPVDYDGAEPLGSYQGLWDSWPQITNLRSAYQWDPNADGQGRGAWVREDGRYADLARFFLTVEAGDLERGDPGADLLDRGDDAPRPFYDPASANSVLAINGAQEFNGPILGIEQREIYGLHMSQLAEWYDNPGLNRDEPQPYEPVDERFWADADGDGRPDARWTVLDELAGAEGLIWVAAARIVDSSAAVNVNSSIEGLPPSGSGLLPGDLIGDGATPADIDLYRLLAEGTVNGLIANSASSTGAVSLRHPDVVNLEFTDLNQGWYEHVINGLRMENFIEQTLAGNDARISGYFENEANPQLRNRLFWDDAPTGDERLRLEQTGGPAPAVREPTTRAQREAWWRLFAGARDPLPGADRYALSEEVDLRFALGSTSPGVITELESRFDGPVRRLPEEVDYPSEEQSLGPMRASEHADAVSTADFTLVSRPGLTTTNYTQQDRIERIQKDIRRSLTVYSGTSARSVVPPLGDKPVPRDRTKPIVNELPRRDLQQAVDESFDAFMWALAPLAANKPLHRDLYENIAGTYDLNYEQSYARDADYHYGGGTNGPAAGWADEFGLTTDDLGPTYALFRAASLAVNLVDAVDDEGNQPSPTVARLFTAPEPDLAAYPPTSTTLDNVAVLTTRLTQGDMASGDSDASLRDGTVPGGPVVPALITPQPNHGVTFVGLDRQPFISQAFVVCLYEYEEDASALPDMTPREDPVTIDGDPVGRAIVAVELINPWNKPLLLDDHVIMLTDGGNEFVEIPLDAVEIPAGSRFVAIWADFERGEDFFGDSLDAFEAEIAVDSFVFEDTDSPFADPDQPFAGWDVDNTAVLLYRNSYPNVGAQVLLDRMVNDGAGDFPHTQEQAGLSEGDLVLTPSDTADTIGVRFATAAGLARIGDYPSGGGFPQEVIERAADNEVEVVTPDSSTAAEGWHETRPALSHVELIAGEWGAAFTLGDVPFASGDMLPQGFQLFVPDGPLVAAAELGMISAFAHTYRHNSTGASTVTPADADPAASLWTTVSEQLGKDYHLNYDGSGSASGRPADATAANPFLGVLDPTRFILGSNADLNNGAPDNALGNLPDSLAIPLALRVFEAFEVLGENLNVAEPLIPGRININTAPKRVLAALPLVLPVDYQTGAVPSPFLSNDLTVDNAYARLNAILRYRERLGTSGWTPFDSELRWNAFNYTEPDDLTQLTATPEGLRVRYDDAGAADLPAAGANVHRVDRGFAAMGELAILAEWNAPTGGAAPTLRSGTNNVGFQELSFDMRDNTLTNAERNALDARPPVRLEPGGYVPFDFDGTTLEPTDDPEERLAIFRAVSNVASTRSDVYHAWYILRAYSPAAIEAIEVGPSLTDMEKVELLNELEPVFERRELVVLDRSNVADPADRPRVIQRVELDATGADN